MRYALETIALNEQRFIVPFLQHIPDWVDKKLVLVSEKPWVGRPIEPDSTFFVAGRAKLDAVPIKGSWKTEEDQRNMGVGLLEDYDWVLVLDPDEFLDDKNWEKLHQFLETTDADAVIVEHQRVFWKDKEVYPHSDYQQLIAVRPHVRFVDKRVVDSPYVTAPVELLHFSWARTNQEVWEKITHYSHANEFDTRKWFHDVWMAGKTENLHPLTPETLKGLKDAFVPPEIGELDLFVKPSKKPVKG